MSDMSEARDRERTTYLVCPDIPGRGDIPDIPDAAKRHTPGYVGYVARYVAFVANQRFLRVSFDLARRWTAAWGGYGGADHAHGNIFCIVIMHV